MSAAACRLDTTQRAADNVALRRAAQEGPLAVLEFCRDVVVREAGYRDDSDFADDIEAAFNDLARELS